MRLSRRALILGFAALPIGCRRAQADTGGWRQARWGMDSVALDAAFGTAIRPIDPPMAFGSLLARRAVPDVRIAGRRFTAFLQHPQGRDALRQVLLQFYSGRPAPADFVAVRDLLLAEFGQPRGRNTETDDSRDIPALAATIVWHRHDTQVVLRYVDPNTEPYSGVRKSLTVRYTAVA